jgi:hypothetical protein
VPDDGGGVERHVDPATREVEAEPDVGGEHSRTEAADEVEGSSLDEEIGRLAEPAHVWAAAEDAAELAREGPDLRTARHGLGRHGAGDGGRARVGANDESLQPVLRRNAVGVGEDEQRCA